MSGGLKVIAAGPGSTLQDRGRLGHQRFGVSTAGAADPLLLAASNALVGNDAFEGAIEFTLVGDTLEVAARSCRIAVTGDAELTIDGQPHLPWTSHRLDQGQRLRVGALATGARGYLAVAGGIWAIGGAAYEGARYDAVVHAVFLGFTLSMVMAHAPVILPAVLRRPLPYHPGLWAPLLLLHGSLVLRTWVGDGLGVSEVWQVAGVLNAASLLLFVVVAAWSTVRPASSGGHR